MGRKRRPAPAQSHEPGNYTQCPKENAAFEDYYSQQLGLVAEERAAFIATLQEQLPVVFRLNPVYPGHEKLQSILTAPGQMSALIGDVEISQVPWYPRGLTWQVQTTRSRLKRDPAAKAFHQFLNQASESGLVTRQELVSMLPILALDIRPGHHVIDLCAAPGSKTSQCIEELNGRGFVLANDADPNRAHMLIHQLHRANTSLMAVVNHQAQFFPSISSKGRPFLFDRVICDVPCTGDGAIRKIPTKWKTWTERDAFGVHAVQVDILSRAIALCKEDGLVAYSTCSLNPVEDEAVVSTVLKRFPGEVELVDLVDRFHTICPGLIVRPGLPVWRVLMRDKKAERKDEFCEVAKGQEFGGFTPRETCFADGHNEEMKKTVRVLPHDQNTGGFFIALVRKVRKQDAIIVDEPEVEDKGVECRFSKPPKRPDFLRLSSDSEEFHELKECYGLTEDFPVRQLLAISESKRSNIFFVSQDLADFLALDVENRLALFSLGVRTFCKNREKGSKEDCIYRLCQEGVPFVSRFVTRRRVLSSSFPLFRELLVSHSIGLDLEVCTALAAQIEGQLGYFVVTFTNLCELCQRAVPHNCLSIPEELVVLKHPTNRLSSMASDEHTAGLKLVHQIFSP